VGKLVAKMAHESGYQVLVSDPPLGIGLSLAEIAPQCDVLTFHTPLSHDGAHATYHLCNAAILERCKPDVLLINAARGGIVDERALLAKLSGETRDAEDGQMQCVIDCWENEPVIDEELLKKVNLGSFHIAGYSLEGKMRASAMCLAAFCAFFSLPILSINKKVVPLQGDSAPGWIKRITNQLKTAPEHFEQLRKQYKLR
jgi:erythronate-4-phosphate dehydrogenase